MGRRVEKQRNGHLQEQTLIQNFNFENIMMTMSECSNTFLSKKQSFPIFNEVCGIIVIKMQAIRSRYNNVSVAYYNLFRKYITNNPIQPYGVYAFRKVSTEFPKIAYQNPFEPAYTRAEVKYNAHIVVPMILLTLWYSRKVVAEEESKQVHHS